MSLISFTEQTRLNPLDVVERVAATNGWSFERAGEDEITILVRGKCCLLYTSPSPRD